MATCLPRSTYSCAGLYVDGRKYFELATFYDAFEPWQDRRLPMRYAERTDAVDVDREWQARNGGERRVAGVPTV